MRAKTGMAVIAVMGLATGCSNMAPSTYSSRVDSEKVGLINAVARQRGVDVIWINPPRKPALASNAANLAIE